MMLQVYFVPDLVAAGICTCRHSPEMLKCACSESLCKIKKNSRYVDVSMSNLGCQATDDLVIKRVLQRK